MTRHATTHGIDLPGRDRLGLRAWLGNVRPLRARVGWPSSPVVLPAEVTWSGKAEPGTAVRLLEGNAWLTFEGDAEDHILEAPALFTAPQRGRIAIWALTPLRFELARCAARAARPRSLTAERGAGPDAPLLRS